MDIFTSVQRTITQHQLINHGDTVVVGLSGGPDSVCLLHILHQMRRDYSLTLIAAHLDHQWRADSDKDVQWCAHLCATLDIPFVSATLSEIPLSTAYNGSKEAYARAARRHFFESVAQTHHAQAIALAHHKQDQMETFFIRLMRGATITGLSGMKYKDGKYIRPLLDSNKKDIEDYLYAHSLTYLTDPSNDSHDFLRNRIRHTVLPALYQTDDRFEKNFFSTLHHIQEADAFIEQQAQQAYNTISTDNYQQINYIQLSTLPVVLQYRILLLWFKQHQVPFPVSQGFFDEVLKYVLKGMAPSHSIHPQWSLDKKNSSVTLIKK
jgi:tRNA(Ile)-lysidine synthase